MQKAQLRPQAAPEEPSAGTANLLAVRREQGRSLRVVAPAKLCRIARHPGRLISRKQIMHRNALKTAVPNLAARPAGIHFVADAGAARRKALAWLERLELLDYVECRAEQGSVAVSLQDRLAEGCAPWFDTSRLCEHFGLNTDDAYDIEREIILALLAAPRPFKYRSFEEFAASVRMRRNIVLAARKTQLAFDTSAAERPAAYWTYSDDRGFTLLPGKPLIAALEKATQPDATGKLYSFSCYRATEYVILLGMAQEIERSNPPLLQRLQIQWETRAIKSGPFHETFLHEFGSMDEPLPAAYYVPGDRVWFRNPDARSSDIEGFEGSWVFYLGGGLFSNFWKRNQPYTLTTKALEIFHWRHGARLNDRGQLVMDEAVVEARVRQSLAEPVEVRRILERMLRLRDPQGVYDAGGCIDASREFPRCVCPGTAELVLPVL